MLVGLAAKNGILIVEFANQRRDAGLSVRDAILEASATRLRPILMTSIATVVGALAIGVRWWPGLGQPQRDRRGGRVWRCHLDLLYPLHYSDGLSLVGALHHPAGSGVVRNWTL